MSDSQEDVAISACRKPSWRGAALLAAVGAVSACSPMVSAQQVVVSVATPTLKQYEPLMVSLNVVNNTAAAVTVEFSRQLLLEKKITANTWQLVTPWVGVNPWDFDIDQGGYFTDIVLKDMPAASEHWIVWRPLLSPAALVPGDYRIRSVEALVSDTVVASSQPVMFTVVAHTGNATAAAASMDLYQRLMSRELSGGLDNGLVVFAQSWHADASLSDGLREWAAAELAEFFFTRFDYVGSKAIAQQVPATSFPLPCGGLGQCAQFHVIRADRQMSITKVQFDLMTVPLTQLLTQYPKFIDAYRYPTYDNRRKFLQ